MGPVGLLIPTDCLWENGCAKLSVIKEKFLKILVFPVLFLYWIIFTLGFLIWVSSG